jgi:hypothetical protein
MTGGVWISGDCPNMNKYKHKLLDLLGLPNSFHIYDFQGLSTFLGPLKHDKYFSLAIGIETHWIASQQIAKSIRYITLNILRSYFANVMFKNNSF